ncbi:MAG: tyrosine-type recombinase/integrase [Kineosporiaceae bacterium]
MSVTKRPDGKWRARYRDATGREHARHFARKTDATRWLADVKAKLSAGEWLDPALSRVTVGEWAALWIASQPHLEETTLARYAGLVRNHIVPVWGSVQLAAVTHAHVATWVRAMQNEGQSASSVRATYGVFSRVLDHAVRDGRLSRNPAAAVRLPRLRKPEKRYLTHGQVADLARECGEYASLIRTLAYTGLRWSEVAALRAKRVRLDRYELVVAEGMKDVNGVISFSETKTHRVRIIPFPGVLAPDLAAAVDGKQTDDLVFTSSRGGPLRNQNFRRDVFDPAATRAGLAELTPHELRHTAASLAVSAGANVKAVQRMLGHASAAMTLDVYADLFDTDHGDVASRLDEAIRAHSLRTAAD